MKPILMPALAATTALWSAAAVAQSSDMAGFCEAAIVPVDTDADGMVTAEENTAVRDAEFAALDANADGSIDRTEWETCMERQQQARAESPSGTWSPEDFADYTPEVSGDLSAEDFAGMATEAYESGSAEERARFTGSDAMPQDDSGASEAETFARAAVSRFRDADTDGDGTLTAEEFGMSGDGMTADAQSARFDSLDADDTGTVTPQEYRAAGTWAVDPSGLVDGAEQTGSEAGTATDGMASADTAQSEDDMGEGIPVIDYFVVYY